MHVTHDATPGASTDANTTTTTTTAAVAAATTTYQNPKYHLAGLLRQESMGHQSHLAAIVTAALTKHASALRRRIMYDDKIFVSRSNTANGEVGAHTRFHYHQRDGIVWAEYTGGSIVRGSLIATVRDDGVGTLDLRYHHVNTHGELMTGECVSTPEVLADGRLRLHEKWRWTSGDRSSGESVIEEEEVREDTTTATTMTTS